VIEAPQLDTDARFSSNLARIQNLPALVEILDGYLRKDTTENWLRRMEEAKLPAGPVLDILEMHDDVQANARDMIVELDHPKAGRMKTLGHPVKFSKTPAEVTRAAPLLGQHSREILKQAGYGGDEIDALIRSDAVFAT
jgi:crotonobetainyl-CoA:carnitine CoA-transferase CaiB-like acyl-CoA transferase